MPLKQTQCIILHKTDKHFSVPVVYKSMAEKTGISRKPFDFQHSMNY